MPDRAPRQIEVDHLRVGDVRRHHHCHPEALGKLQHSRETKVMAEVVQMLLINIKQVGRNLVLPLETEGHSKNITQQGSDLPF